MTKYRFDWKDVIHGSIEIEANCGNDAEDILMNMSLKDLLKTSGFVIDRALLHFFFIKHNKFINTHIIIEDPHPLIPSHEFHNI